MEWLYQRQSDIISGNESPPGTALLCLKKMTEILYPVYYTLSKHYLLNLGSEITIPS